MIKTVWYVPKEDQLYLAWRYEDHTESVPTFEDAMCDFTLAGNIIEVLEDIMFNGWIYIGEFE